MTKSRLKVVISLLIAIIMLFTCTASFAENEVTTENSDTTLISEDQVEQGNAAQEAHSSDLYACDQTVNVDYTVDGNAFILAQTVNITGQIGGDAFILAETINIDGGYIYSNLFAVADNITINGIVYDLYSSSNNVTVGDNGYVYRDAHAIANDVNVFGAIGRDMHAVCNNISFVAGEDTSSHGTIYGALNYTAENEISIDESYVEGGINFNKATTTEPTNTFDVPGFIAMVVTYIIMAAIAYMIYAKLTPRFNESSNDILKKKFLPVVGYGLLGIVAAFIIMMLLMILSMSLKLMLLLIALFTSALLISALIFIATIAQLIVSKFNLNGTWKKLGIVALVTIVLLLLELIPYVGGFIELAAMVIGAGTIIKHCLPSKNEETKPDNQEQKED